MAYCPQCGKPVKRGKETRDGKLFPGKILHHACLVIARKLHKRDDPRKQFNYRRFFV